MFRFEDRADGVRIGLPYLGDDVGCLLFGYKPVVLKI